MRRQATNKVTIASMTDTTTILRESCFGSRGGRAYAAAAICCPVSGTASEEPIFHRAISLNENSRVTSRRDVGRTCMIYLLPHSPIGRVNKPEEQAVGFDIACTDPFWGCKVGLQSGYAPGMFSIDLEPNVTEVRKRVGGSGTLARH
jgi:hypothetical protein